MKTYSIDPGIDRGEWPQDGEWMTEPDRVEWIATRERLYCLARRNSNSGCWLGYVGVLPGQPYYMRNYNSITGITVHGSLTYSGFSGRGIHRTWDKRGNDPIWWLGFDCGHYMDAIITLPGVSAELKDHFNESSTYRTMNYVIREINQLAQQIASAKNG